MTLAAIAPLATSPVTITGIGNVRLKESDRIAAMEENLGRTGVTTESGPDCLRVFPATPRGARVDPHGDHRIAMAFSVLGLRRPGSSSRTRAAWPRPARRSSISGRRLEQGRREPTPGGVNPATGNRASWAK